jgi:major membrane immunogen (membrane-anchored lipoprotein)
LNGSNPMTVQCGVGYVEPGATATDTCDGTLAVTITGSVLTSKGTYTVTYKATDSSGNTATVTRTVNVVDTTAPVITLNGSNPMTVQCGSGYVEPGATATDTCDGGLAVTITGSVLTSKGTYTVTYKATDSSGNTATVTRTVNVVDTIAPVITLNGSNPMTIQCGAGYVEPGATATDACQGSIAVVITGSVPSAKGTYTITYKATDASGNVATATRTVNVIDTVAPVITLNGNNPMDVDCKQGYTEPGATALDACDGSVPVVITGSVPSTAGTYIVTYKATDSSGNTATVTRTVNVTSKVPPSANNFNATPTGIKADNKMHNINLHYGFDQHCAAYSWDVECTANQTVAPGDITKVDNNNFTVKGVTGRIYTFALTVTDINGNTATYTITVACT